MKFNSHFFMWLSGLLVILMSQTSKGAVQQVNDSLKSIITAQPENTGKADNLILLTKNYIASNKLDTALYYCEIAHAISNRLDYVVGKADCLYLKSLIFRLKFNYEASMSLTDGYTELYLLINDSLKLAKGYYNLGSLHQAMEEYEFSLFYFQKSLSYCLSINEPILLIGNYIAIGTNFMNSKLMYDSASHYYLKAMAICEQTGNVNTLANVLNSLGNVYVEDKQYDNAREFYNRSLEISMRDKREASMAASYNGLGRIASEEADFEEAISYYDKAAEIFYRQSDTRGLANINNNYGDIYFKQKKYDLALGKFNNALATYKDLHFEKGIILTLLNLSAVYSEMGSVKQALALQDSCLKLAYQPGNMNLYMLALKNIADNNRKAGNFEEAYTYLLEYKILSDSVFNIERAKAIHVTMLKYEKEKDQARILLLEKENLQKTNQRNAYMFTGLGLLVIALFTVLYFRQKSRHQKIITEQKIRQLEEEKKLMSAKLLVEGQEEERKRIATELHDGLGVLLSATKMQFSVISDKSPENRELIAKATRMLEQASGDVRKISHNMMPGLLTKLGFYEAVEDLFERIADTGEIQAICTITGEPERLPENREIMLYRIVQEMVNNTLKYARAKNIDIRIQILPEIIIIHYSDDGIGFDYDQKIQNESIGLKSIQSRVNFLNGKISVDSKPGKGVNYNLQIPV